MVFHQSFHTEYHLRSFPAKEFHESNSLDKRSKIILFMLSSNYNRLGLRLLIFLLFQVITSKNLINFGHRMLLSAYLAST